MKLAAAFLLVAFVAMVAAKDSGSSLIARQKSEIHARMEAKSTLMRALAKDKMNIEQQNEANHHSWRFSARFKTANKRAEYQSQFLVGFRQVLAGINTMIEELQGLADQQAEMNEQNRSGLNNDLDASLDDQIEQLNGLIDQLDESLSTYDPEGELKQMYEQMMNDQASGEVLPGYDHLSFLQSGSMGNAYTISDRVRQNPPLLVTQEDAYVLKAEVKNMLRATQLFRDTFHRHPVGALNLH